VTAIAMDQDHPSEGTRVSRLTTRRPIAVTFVGALALLVGTYHAVDGVVVLVNGADANELAEAAFDLALGMLAIAIGGGALRMKRWAWAAFMTWAVIGLTHQLLRHFFYGNPNYLAMAVDTIAVLALTPVDVQIAFGVRPPRNVTLDHVPRNPIDSN
jgi:hypothetical protein